LEDGAMELDKLGVWYFTDPLAAPDAAAMAQRIESLGYSALWIPETLGRNALVHAAWLLANTRTLNIATGIANLYLREPGAALAAQNALAEQSGDRFLLGLGVSHQPLVEGVRGRKYGKPVATMKRYLEQMDAAPYNAFAPPRRPPRVIAALGPRMLELAREQCDGAHPYFTSPDHTRMAREILGPDKMLCVEQKIILETDASRARELARRVARMYIGLPNYRNNWLRMGLSESDFEDGGSDRFIDTTFAWGTLDDIRARIQAHLDAGASHVCVQPINPSGDLRALHWQALEALSGSA
jgi:probable F420-dependent oxidoreductase